MLVLIPVPSDKKYFGYCFVTQPPLSLLLICCGSYQVVITFLQRHITFCFLSVTLCGIFFVIMMRAHQEGGRVQDRDGFRSA